MCERERNRDRLDLECVCDFPCSQSVLFREVSHTDPSFFNGRAVENETSDNLPSLSSVLFHLQRVPGQTRVLFNAEVCTLCIVCVSSHRAWRRYDGGMCYRS